jgi:hypothetical protein
LIAPHFRASEWRRTFDNFSGPEELNSMIAAKLAVNGSHAVSAWYNDQWAVTHGLLKEKICTIPESSTTW